jgi:hypothetical protein
MKTFLATLVVVLVLAPVRAAEEAKPVAVPFELLKTKHITVMVKVNGKGPYRVIFDTGAPFTVLSTEVGKEAGLLKDAKKGGFSLFGPMSQVKVKELEVGDLKAEGVPALVMDHPTVKAMAKVLGPIEGIVGFPFFARYRMTLDYQAMQMTFVPSGYDPPDVLEDMMAAMMALTKEQKPERVVLAPAGQWGIVPHKADDAEEPGVTVKEVLPGSAAAAAGLKAGDRLLTLDGRWTDSVADLYEAAGHVKLGSAAKVVVRRDGKEVALTVTPRPGL